MKIALCPSLSQDLQFRENLQRLEDKATRASVLGADLALFGEAFLQGFDAMCWDYEKDIPNAYAMSSEEIALIRQIAREQKIAIGFGLIENHQGGIYSSYAVLDKNGETADLYRRVSTGWKEEKAYVNPDYREGKSFHSFELEGKRFASMICGDFWEDELIPQIVELDPEVDAFLWPVHCDYTTEDWEGGEFEAYEDRSAILAKPVFFVDNYRDPLLGIDPRAHGRAYVWQQGKTLAKEPRDPEQLLIYEL